MRRLARWALALALAAVAAALMAAAALRLYLGTDAGGRRLARALEGAARGEIQGEVSLGTVSLEGLDALRVEGIALRAPSGEVLARARAARVDTRPWTLLSRRVVLDAIEVEGLDAVAERGADGRVPLIEVLRGRGDRGKATDIVVRSFRAAIVRAGWRAAPGAAERFLAVGGEVRGVLSAHGPAVEFSLDADLALAAPVRGWARAEASGAWKHGALELSRFRASLPGGIVIEGADRRGTLRLPPPLRPARGGLDVEPARGQADAVQTSLMRPATAAPPPAAGIAQRTGEVRASITIPPGGLVQYGGPRLAGPVRVDARLSFGDKVRFDAVARPPGPGTISLQGWFAAGVPRRFDVALRADGIDPARLIEWAPPGRIWLTAEAAGALAVPPHADARGSIRLERGSRLAGRPVYGRTRFAMRGDAWDVRGLSLRLPGVSLTGSAGGFGARKLRSAKLALVASDLGEASAALRALQAPLPELAGEAEAGLSWPARGAARGWLAARGLAVAGARLGDLRGEATLHEGALVAQAEWTDPVPAALALRATSLGLGRARLDALSLRWPGAVWTLEGPAALQWPQNRLTVRGLVLRGPGMVSLSASLPRGGDGAVQAEVRAAALDLAVLAPFLPSPAGRADAEARLGGTLDWPHLECDVRLEGASFAGGPPFSARVSLSAHGPLAAPQASAHVALRQAALGPFPPLTAEIWLEAGARSVHAQAEGAFQGAPPMEASLTLGAPLNALLRGARRAVPVQGSLISGPGPVSVPGRLSARSARLEATVQGTLAHPEGTLAVNVKALAIPRGPLGDLALRARADGDRLSGSLMVAPPGGGRLMATARGPRRGRGWEGTLLAEQARLDVLALLPRVREIEGGTADGQLVLRAGRRAPEIEGQLWVRAARVVLGEVGTFRSVELDLEGAGSALRLARGRLAARGGKTGVEGALAWRPDGWSLGARLKLDDFPLPAPARPSALVTTHVNLDLKQAGDQVQGKVVFSPGTVELFEEATRQLLDTELPPDFHVHTPRGQEPARPPWWRRWLAQRRALVLLETPPGLWVQSDQLNVEASARMRLLWDGAQLALGGELTVLRGQATFLSRRFEVDRLMLAFTGQTPVDAAIDGLLLFRQPDVEVQVALSGTLRAPEVELRSDPPALGGGAGLLLSGAGAHGTALAGTAAAGVLNWLAGKVRSALQETLPLDVLALELGPSGVATRIEAGAYFGPRLFVSVVRNLLAGPEDNVLEVQAELMLLTRLSLRGRYGDRQTGSLDLFFERRFRSPAQRRAHERRQTTMGRPSRRDSIADTVENSSSPPSRADQRPLEGS